MKLHTVNATRLIFHCVQSVVRQRCYLKTWRNFGHVVAMAHPDIELLWQTLEQTTRDVQNFQACVTKLTIWRRDHRAAKLARKHLKAIADPQRRTVDGLE